MEQLLKCTRCKEDKPLSEFWKRSSIKRGYDYLCHHCRNKYYSKRNKENYNKWAKEYRTKQHYKDYEKAFRKEYLSSLSGAASKMLSGARSRAKKIDKECTLTKEWILENLKDMTCSVTGIKLTLEKYKGSGWAYKYPFNPSIDRIDSSKGYTAENCRIVCWIYNLSKANWTDNEVLIMAQALIQQQILLSRLLSA